MRHLIKHYPPVEVGLGLGNLSVIAGEEFFVDVQEMAKADVIFMMAVE